MELWQSRRSLRRNWRTEFPARWSLPLGLLLARLHLRANRPGPLHFRHFAFGTARPWTPLPLSLLRYQHR